MTQIAIIDDNFEQGDSLRKILKGYLRRFGSSLTVVLQHPFENIEDYFSYVEQNGICVFILDERLNDMAATDGTLVSYKGNQLVVELRKRLKDFPIFMITTFTNDEDVFGRRHEFENVLSRGEINTETVANVEIPRIIRSAQRYLDANRLELSQFNELTNKIASGIYDPEELNLLQALQLKLEISHSGFADRQSWLDEYAKQIRDLADLKQVLLKKLNE